MLELGPLAFTTPWLLASLAFLSVIWWLLKITPPRPKIIAIPTISFLKELDSETRTPAKTPLLILLLRMLIATMIILALSGPVLNPPKSYVPGGTIRLIIDNGWASAAHWDKQINAATALLSQSQNHETNVLLYLSAPTSDQASSQIKGRMTLSEARNAVKNLEPQPWTNNYNALIKHVSETQNGDNPYSYLFSGGILTEWTEDTRTKDSFMELVDLLQRNGGLTLYTAEAKDLSPVLSMPTQTTKNLTVQIDLPTAHIAETAFTVNALGDNAKILSSQSFTFAPGETSAVIEFDMPDEARNDIQSIKLQGYQTIGTHIVMDENYRRRPVGIASNIDIENAQALIDPVFYLERALSPYTSLHIEPLNSLLDKKLAVIILPDAAAITPEAQEKLEQWIAKGGTLIRFAGPAMTTSQQPVLVPVPLRYGGRAMEGKMTWQQPQKLDHAPSHSPFYGLDIPADVQVSQQILAAPGLNIAEKTWIGLEDGTPIVTADKREQGWLVLFHTTATPDWSNLVFSGLFVDMLQRIVQLSRGIEGFENAALLKPLKTFDGYAQWSTPPGFAQSMTYDDFKSTRPNPKHIPGLYGHALFRHAYNFSDNLVSLESLPETPNGVEALYYRDEHIRELKPDVLFAAAVLALIDLLLMLWMRYETALLRIPQKARAGSFVLAVLLLSAHSAMAAEEDGIDTEEAEAIYLSRGTFLAYVETGDMSVDQTSEAGLEALVAVLKSRTSIEPEGVIAVDVDQDSLAFFPLIYWPMTTTQPPLSPQAVQNVQYYLDHGGTILFDTRDQQYGTSKLRGPGSGERHLRVLTTHLRIPPLAPIPQGHVLGRSFYLLDHYPGRYSDGPLWIEENAENDRDGVSSIIVGSNDWASAWATERTGSGLRPVLPGGERQLEMSYRFGVNLMMYALTGNYKADQIHIPHILKRLGQ